MNRAILSRMMAKKAMVLPEVAVKASGKTDLGKIAMMDPETKEVVEVFESIELAVEKGYSMPHIVGAVKNGNKYKGHLWTAVTE